MENKVFRKITDKYGTYIYEGRLLDHNVVFAERFVCTIAQQKTEEQTQRIADEILQKLNSK